MATQVTQNTFLSEYNDDWRDSDHYHRILFNSGRALQARELTQSQTIIQEEIAKLAGFVFKEGGIFNTSYGTLNSGFNALGFVKVDSLPTGYATLVGTDIESTDGVTATVKAVIPATGGDNNTLMVRYISSNNLSASDTTAPRIFQSGNSLAYDTGTISGNLAVQTTNTSINPAVGKGSMIDVPQFNTFAGGHLIMVEQQSLVISKYSSTPTTTVGFKLTEQVIAATDEIALYDNSGSTPNVTSPGADRYKITMTLVEEADVAAGDTFYPVYDIISGEARAIQSSDNLLNELGTILGNRTDNITGNFIVRNNPLGEMDLEVAQDSDSNYLLYKLDGGVGFVNGQRIEKSKTTTLRVIKPRNDPNDIDEKTNEFIAARYGNYFLADTAKGLLGGISNLDTVNLKNGINLGSGATTIGTARVRNLDEFDNKFRIHMFDVVMDSDGSGSIYNVGSVRSIGTDSDNYANIAAVDARYDLHDKSENSLLFPLRKSRVNEVSSVTMNVRKIYTDTTTAGGQATFSTGSSNVFANIEDWIVSVDSSGELISSPEVTGFTFGTDTSADITSLPTNSAVKLLGYETLSATRKTKSLNTGSVETVGLANNKFVLSKADIYKFTSVVDASTNEDITYKFIFDNGQRDNFYTVGGGRLKKGTAAPSGNITVTFDYFSHNAGDFFAGKASYPDVAYENVPDHVTTNGIRYKLTDVIDMRPVKDNTGSNFTGTGSVIENIPKNTDIITIGTAKFWEPRIDIVSLSVEGELKANIGVTDPVPSDPSVSNTDMLLHKVTLEPYTIDQKDLLVDTYSNLGYQMSDIQDLASRIDNLEEAVTLTLSELQTQQITIPDPNDATLPDRLKLGLTADTFSGNFQSEIFSEDYRAGINPTTGVMGPIRYLRSLPMKYDSDASFGTILKGNTIWPKYTEEVMIDQSVASKSINVNQFEMSKSIGAGYLEPNTDTWTVRKKVDNSYKAESNTSYLAKGSTSVSSQGDQKG